MNGKVDRIRVIESAEKYVRSGRLKEAIAEYEKLLNGDPQDFGINNIIGDLCVQLGQNEKAVRSYQNVASEYEKRGLQSQALAVYKKIVKIKPESTEMGLRLADLYNLQGYSAEAKKEYIKIAAQMMRSNMSAEAMQIYEKIVKLDKDDIESKIKLAGLYKDQGLKDAAAEHLDDIAESKLSQDKLEEAEKYFLEAREIHPFFARTIMGLAEIHTRRGEKGQAIKLIEEALQDNKDNPQLLNLFGNTCFENGDFQKAEETFSLLVKAHPANVNARIKLGRIYIRNDDLDPAFELYEPLVNNLIKKQKDEKAIGLLGLILATQKTHLPSLDKLSAIYRNNKDLAKLEVVDRVILDELLRRKQKDKAAAVLSELVKIRPDDPDLVTEYKLLRKDLDLPEEEIGEGSASSITKEDREIIKESLAQADVYIQQGLVRNARRILDNLKTKYSEDPLILQKIAVLDDIRSRMSDDEIRVRVEKAQALESQAKEKADIEKEEVGKLAKKGKPKEGRTVSFPPFAGEIMDEEKISTADIFAETDIIPFLSMEMGERKYYELKTLVEQEIRIIEAICTQQANGITTQFEKELSVIVSDFKKGLKEKVQSEDYEIHYQLGIAFIEQALYHEAIEEFMLASKDKSRALECFSIISHCYRLRKNYQEAERWLNKALLMTKEGTESYFALIYDRAILSEEAQEKEKALSLYREIQTWNPAYRGISDKVSRMEKAASQ